jgi:hypothetical protein
VLLLLLQSEEVEWDYAPTGSNVCSGAKTPFDEAALVFLGKSPNRIGPVNSKALYVEYQDATFKKQVVSPAIPCAYVKKISPCCAHKQHKLRAEGYVAVTFVRTARGAGG